MPPWRPIRYLREQDDIAKTRNRLPHWQQEEACYFITFRLADSLPESLLAGLREERAIWLDLHPKPWSLDTELSYHNRFSRPIDRWLDQGHGKCELALPHAAQHLANAMQYFDEKRYLLHSWVIMPNHVHILASMAAESDLGKVISSWKSFSARKINAAMGREGPLWQKDYFDRIIRDKEHFTNVAGYVAKHRVQNTAAVLYRAPWLEV